jgi:hypothetical protein
VGGSSFRRAAVSSDRIRESSTRSWVALAAKALPIIESIHELNRKTCDDLHLGISTAGLVFLTQQAQQNDLGRLKLRHEFFVVATGLQRASRIKEFPGTKYDDQVDSTTRALDHMLEDDVLATYLKAFGR